MDGKEGKKRSRSNSKPSGSSQASDAFKGLESFMRALSGKRVKIIENLGDEIEKYEGIVRPHDSSVRRKQNLDHSPLQISVMRTSDSFECTFNVRDLVSPDANTPYLPELRKDIPLHDIRDISLEWVKDASDEDMKKDLQVVETMYKQRPYVGGCSEGKKIVQDGRPSHLHGKRIKVWWEGERNWFPGQVTEVRSKYREMHVAYDDGDAASVSYATDVWKLDEDVPQEQPIEEAPPSNVQTNSKPTNRGRSSASQKKFQAKDTASSLITFDGEYQLWSEGKSGLQLAVKSPQPLSNKIIVSDGGHGITFKTQEKSSENGKEFIFITYRKIRKAAHATKKEEFYRIDITTGPEQKAARIE